MISKNHIKKQLILLFVTLGIISAQAQSVEVESENNWSVGFGVGPNLSQLDAVGDELKSSYGFALWGQKNIGEKNRLDISADYFDFSGQSRNYRAISLGYGWKIMRESYLKPFVSLGLGVGQAEQFPRAVKTLQTTPNLFARFGFEHLYSFGNWKLGLMIDYLQPELDGNLAKRAYLGLPLLTLSYEFKTAKTQSPAPVATPVIAPDPDSDNDGVPDKDDQCPNTSLGKTVNSIGCEAVEIVKKNLRVEFETNKAEILPDYENQIAEFADFMKKFSDLKVQIEGHTDSIGATPWNRTLSKLRADAVRTRLIEKYQIAADRITAVGFGPDKPEVKNNSKANRKKNRRVLALLQTK